MIEAYSAEKAEGCFILYQLENGAYMSETYMFHIQLFGQVLLATRKYVFLLKRHHYDFSKIWRIDINSKTTQHLKIEFAYLLVLFRHIGVLYSDGREGRCD